MTSDPRFPGASKLGCGCASLGSRVGAKQGIAALELAYERGANWFDLAPSYGDGKAHSIFREFAGSKRDKILICSKVGILPPKVNLFVAAAKPFARQLVKAFPKARSAVSAARAPKAVEIHAAELRRSLEVTLRDLGTDYLDVLALHDPARAVLSDPEVLQTLEDLRKEGKVRAIGVAGSRRVATLAMAAPELFEHVQYSLDFWSPAPPEETDRAQSHAVHSVLKQGQALHGQISRKNCISQIQRLLEDRGYQGDIKTQLSALSLEFALSQPEVRTVVISMLSKASIAKNFDCLESDRRFKNNVGMILSEIFDIIDGQSHKER